MRDALAHAFPRREPRALHHRPCFVHPEEGNLALRVRGADDAERGTVTGRRQRARVAVRENPRVRRHECRAVVAERAIGGEVFGEDRLRLGDQAGARLGHGPPRQTGRDRAHALERPEEIHRGRPRGGQPLDRGLEIGQQRLAARRCALARGQRDAERGGDADRGRAADDERADGLGDVVPARVLALDFTSRQERLVEEHQSLARPADGSDRADHRSVRPPLHQRTARFSHSSRSMFILKLCALPSRSTRPSRLKPSVRVSPLSQAPPV